MLRIVMGNSDIRCDDFSNAPANAGEEAQAVLSCSTLIGLALPKPAHIESGRSAFTVLTPIDWTAVPTRQKSTTRSRT